GSGRIDGHPGARTRPREVRSDDLGRPGRGEPGPGRPHGADRAGAPPGRRRGRPRALARRPRYPGADRRGRRGRPRGPRARGGACRVTLPPFELHRPRSLEAAEELLAEYGDEAAVYCGGTELLLVMKLGLAAYSNLVDLKGIPRLGVPEQRDGEPCLGAAVTHRAPESSPPGQSLVPALCGMER